MRTLTSSAWKKNPQADSQSWNSAGHRHYTTLACKTPPPHSHAAPFHHIDMLHPSTTRICYTLPPHSQLHPSITLTCYTLPPHACYTLPTHSHAAPFHHSYATPVSLKQSLNRVAYTGYTFLSRTKSRQKKNVVCTCWQSDFIIMSKDT